MYRISGRDVFVYPNRSKRAQEVEPYGRARDARQAELGNSADVFRRGMGRGKLGGDIRAAERVPREARAAGIVAALDFHAHVKSILGRKLLDEPPHLAVPHDGKPQAHALVDPFARSCLTMRA